jgi:hypothetical protein
VSHKVKSPWKVVKISGGKNLGTISEKRSKRAIAEKKTSCEDENKDKRN